MIKRKSKLATVTILIGACTVGAMSIAASEASSSSAILEFGSNGKRNMLYDARQRPQSVLLHGRLYIVYNGDASATKNGKGNAYPMFISYDPQSRKFSKPGQPCVSIFLRRAVTDFPFGQNSTHFPLGRTFVCNGLETRALLKKKPNKNERTIK